MTRWEVQLDAHGKTAALHTGATTHNKAVRLTAVHRNQPGMWPFEPCELLVGGDGLPGLGGDGGPPTLWLGAARRRVGGAFLAESLAQLSVSATAAARIATGGRGPNHFACAR
eukprot:7388326-Prymnesium_polylepis.3